MRNCSDRTKSNGYKLKGGKSGLGIRRNSLVRGTETMKQVVQGGFRCPDRGSVQSQVS